MRDVDESVFWTPADWAWIGALGDLGRYDENGYFWFKSRNDDVIITSGYRVGPGEVESAVLEQAGVVGVPDETRNEVIKAFVQPVAGLEGSDEFREGPGHRPRPTGEIRVPSGDGQAGRERIETCFLCIRSVETANGR